MQFDASTPRANLTVAGRDFTCPQPFTEGYTLKANEASALNQLLCENLRNNVAGKLKVKEGEAPVAFTQEQFDAYAAEYEFGVRGTRGGGEAKLSPIEREARKIAREKVKEAIKAKNIKLSTVSDEQMETLVSQLAAREDIVKEATNRVNRLSKISLDALGLDDLMAPAQASTEQAEQAAA